MSTKVNTDARTSLCSSQVCIGLHWPNATIGNRVVYKFNLSVANSCFRWFDFEISAFYAFKQISQCFQLIFKPITMCNDIINEILQLEHTCQRVMGSNVSTNILIIVHLRTMAGRSLIMALVLFGSPAHSFHQAC